MLDKQHTTADMPMACCSQALSHNILPRGFRALSEHLQLTDKDTGENVEAV